MHGEEVTLAEALKPAGYVSGCFGKWQRMLKRPPEPDPFRSIRDSFWPTEHTEGTES
jgi:arylsulfatase A-like enzyme